MNIVNKGIVSYIFLLLYVIAMLRPMLPVIDYFVNYDYIAEQLCENRNKPILACNGKCYVAKEIEKTLPNLPIDNKSRIPTIDFDKYPVTTLYSFKYVELSFNILQKQNGSISQNVKVENHIEYIFRPPKKLV